MGIYLLTGSLKLWVKLQGVELWAGRSRCHGWWFADRGVGSGFAAVWPPHTHSHRPDRAHRCPWQRVKLPGRGSRRCPRAGDHHWCRELRVEPRVAQMSEYTQGGRRAGKRQGLVREGLRDFVEITLPPSCKHSAGAFTPFFLLLFICHREQ